MPACLAAAVYVAKGDGCAGLFFIIHRSSFIIFSPIRFYKPIPHLQVVDLLQLSADVEGGAGLHASFVREKLCHKLYKFTAPTLVGAENGKPWLETWGIEKMTDKFSLDMRSVTTLGQDLFVTARFNF